MCRARYPGWTMDARRAKLATSLPVHSVRAFMNEPHAQLVVYEFGDFRLEPARRALTHRDGRAVEITAKAFDALVCLVERAGTVVTRAQLTQALWPRTVVEDNSLNKLIAALRRALDDHQEGHYVVTLQSRGYQFVADVRITDGQPPVSDLKRGDAAAGDLRVGSEDALAAPTAEVLSRTRSGLQLTAVGLGAVVLGAVSAWFLAGHFAAEPAAEPVHLSMSFSGTPVAMPFGSRHVAISDDGSSVAILLQDRIWVRRLSDPEAAAIAIDQIGMTNPFFSPNGEWIGFSNNGLLKVSSGGGTPKRLTTMTARPAGASWGADGTIVFATTEGLYRIGENGGEPELLAKPDPKRSERLYAWPQLLPNASAVLFTVLSQDPSEPPQVFVLDLRSLESRPVLTGGAAARYASTGHLIYADGTALKAVAFDLDRRVTRGEALAPSDIAVATTADNGAAEFALSDRGTLLFLAPRAESTADLRTLAWVDRQGTDVSLTLPSNAYQFPRISPDGKHVALDMKIRGNRDVWVWDLGREILTQLTTQPGEDNMPLWSADGRRLFFGSDRGNNFDVYSQPADGSSAAVAVSVSPGLQMPLSLAGNRLVVYEGPRDLSILDLATSTLQPLLHEGEVGTAEVSPDGRWIAYESRESNGQFEVYLRPFPDVAAQREKVSINGGRYPLWGLPDSGELYYVTPAGEVVVVAVEVAPSLRLSTPTKVFELQSPPSYVSPRPYDISRDGRFLVTRPVAAPTDERTDVWVVLNWFAALLASR